MPGSAIRVSVAGGMVSDVSVSDTTGISLGSSRLNTGSFISVGRSSRLDEIASRMSCDACWMSLSYSNTTRNCASPSVDVDVVRCQSMPVIDENASSIGSTTSRSTTSGDAPGYEMLTAIIGCWISGNSSVCSRNNDATPNATSARITVIVT